MVKKKESKKNVQYACMNNESRGKKQPKNATILWSLYKRWKIEIFFFVKLKVKNERIWREKKYDKTRIVEKNFFYYYSHTMVVVVWIDKNHPSIYLFTVKKRKEKKTKKMWTTKTRVDSVAQTHTHTHSV